MRIGFVGIDTSVGLGESLRPLIPAGCRLDILTIAQSVAAVAAGELTVLIVAMDGVSWRDSVALMTELHAVGTNRPLAVLALVPRDDPAALVKAFDLRVADVTGLPVNPHEFRARLASLVRRRQVAFARAAETRTAWRLAVIDPVTGLFNRQHLDSVLPVVIDNARTGGRPMALLMIDLDALKPFNDRWGHAAGDRVLQLVAKALQASVRVTDTVARYGGDEIAVIMPDTDVATARALSARLVDAVGHTSIGLGHDGPAGITVSIGLAHLGPQDGDAKSLLMRADSALYDAKRGGRNRVAEAA